MSGAVGAADAAALRVRLLDAVGGGPGDPGGDVLLDARRVTSFDDLALVAFVAARSRAKHLRHRLVVVDGDDGAAARSLRRTGQVFRTAVYPDTASALRGIAGDRAAVAAHNPLRDRAGDGAVAARA
ncbi:hypothetical protein [Kineococcus sp. SYSU DK004]|uniref:hypothetical protein n=1 Tax=Kineococcus sp. SYSU DK004 TaxID=3383125 RepID=UPI003D7F07B6